MRCALVRPAHRSSGYDEGTQECLGIGYVGAVLRERGHEVVVVDAEMEKLADREAFERVAASDPGLIGFSVMSEDALDSLRRLARDLREAFPRAHLTAGGNLPSFDPEWILRLCPGIDSVIRFEGERPLLELAERLRSGRDFRAVPPAASVDDLDALPFPIRDTLPIALKNGWMAPISSSRGCHARCSFCAVHRFNLDPARPWRFRSPAGVADEIDGLVADFGVREVNFVDDDFIGNRKQGQPRARELAAELIRRGLKVGFSLQCRAEWIDRATFRPLKAAGLRMVFFGVEAVDEESRRRYGKPQSRELVRRTLELLDELDVYAHVGFIMFNPWTRLEDVREAVEFLRDIGHLNIHTATNFLQLSPGTPLLEPLAAGGMAFREPHGGYRWSFADPRTASVKAVFDRVLWPQFPAWYESLMAKWSVLTARRSDERCAHDLRRMDDLVHDVAIRTLDAIESDPGVDLFALVRELSERTACAARS